MADHLTMGIAGSIAPVNRSARGRAWRRSRGRRPAPTDPVVAMDDATQRWLTDVEILDAMLALASDLSQDAVRRSVADSLRGAARSVVPAGVAVGVAASSDGR